MYYKSRIQKFTLEYFSRCVILCDILGYRIQPSLQRCNVTPADVSAAAIAWAAFNDLPITQEINASVSNAEVFPIKFLLLRWHWVRFSLSHDDREGRSSYHNHIKASTHVYDSGREKRSERKPWELTECELRADITQGITSVVEQ